MSWGEWWVGGWNRSHVRVLAQVDTDEARAALVDTNGDGRELWFGIEGKSPDGRWVELLDWDDVGGHHPVELLEVGPKILFGWGTGRPREQKTASYRGVEIPVRVNRNGWWLVLQTAVDVPPADSPA